MAPNTGLKHGLIALFGIFLLVPTLPLKAQTTISSGGNPKNSAVLPVEHGFVNLGNGQLHLEIPIANIPQRGNLSLPATLVYDSSIWEVVNGLDGLQWSPTLPNGWAFDYAQPYGTTASIAAHSCPGDPSRTIFVYTAIQWTDAQQTIHTFPLETIDTEGCGGGGYTDTPTSQGFATDASGYYGRLSSYNNLQIWDSRGTLVLNNPVPSTGVASGTEIDRNGNEIEFGVDGGVLSDTMQHTPIQETVAEHDSNGFPTVLYYDVPVASGHTARYTVNYETIPVATDFHVLASNFVPGESGYVEESNASLRTIQSIVLPDGSSYVFGYDGYGTLNSMTLPHGGTVSYAFTNDSGAGTTDPPRWLSYHSGSDGPTTFSYANQGSYSPTSETGGYSCGKIQNTASGAKLIQTYVFSSCNGAIQPMKVLLSPSSNPSTVDKFTLFHYDFSHPCQNSACSGAQWITLTGMTTVLPSSGTTSSILGGSGGSGLIADTQAGYDSQGDGQVTSAKEWDYYSGTYPTSLPDSPPGNPKRETDTTLGYTVNNVPYPTSVVTKDSTSSVVGEVDYTYDEAGYFVGSPSSVPNHNNSLAAPARGNATTIKQVPHGPGGAPTLTYHLTYDDTGAVVATQDASDQPTTLAYDSTDTFPQTITRPQTAGSGGHPVSHVTSTVRDFNTGQVTSVTDENSQTTSNSYDSLGRLSTIQFTNGGSPVTLETITYPSTNETDVSTLQVQDAFETNTVPSSTTVDGFGRVSQVVRSGVTSETTYDAQGHVYSVTNPHVSTGNPSDGTTHYSYDELGRIQGVTLPNSHSTSYTYSLNTVTITDPLGHQRQETFDAFSNIASVLEPDNSGALNWQTSYVRNDLGSLTEIDQKGGVTDSSQWRRRYFGYDGLGRLSSQTSQEAGQYSYTYDNNGNVLSFTNQNSTANAVSYTYDALNRILTKQVGGGPTYTYTYDAQDSSGDPYGIGRLTSTSDGGSIQARYKHDPSGHVVSEADCRPSNCSFAYQTSATIDFQGNVRALTLPDGRKIEWVYDNFSHPQEEINTFFGADEIDLPILFNATYYPTGQLQDVIHGNGVEESASVDADGNISTLSYNNGSALVDRTFTWATNGLNLTGITDAATGRTQSFTYDQINRLQTSSDTGSTGSAETPGLPTVPASSMSFTYDAWGNLQQSGTYSFIQSFDGGNHVAASGYTYDLAGNLTHDGLGNSYSYRADGHQTTSNGISYSYDALDQRVVKNSTEYFYFGGAIVATRDSSGNWTDYFYGTNGLLGSVPGVETALPTFRIGDHLDTLVQTADAGANVTGGVSTLPFGQILSNSTSDNYIFTDHEWDSENYTDYAMFRQYSPTQGRWLSPDPDAGSYDLTNPQTLNRYAYALNAPEALIDQLGLDYCVVSSGISVCGNGSDSGVETGPGDFGEGQGFSFTVLGGGTTVTAVPHNSAMDPTYAERLAYQYNGPGAASQGGFANCGCPAQGLFHGAGAPYWGGANALVQDATIGATSLYGGAFFAPEIIAGTGAAAGWTANATGALGPAAGRFFWSAIGASAAAERAAEEGGTTLEMTPLGGLANWVQNINGVPKNAATGAVWNWLSTNFAQGAQGPVTYLQGSYLGNTWLYTEMPILLQQGNPITVIQVP